MDYSEQTNPNVLLPLLPNSTAIMVLGILSIVSCWCFGVVGLVLGILALVMAGKASKEYMANYNQYSEASYKNMQAGRICAIIGICLSAFFLVFTLFKILVFGAIMSFIPWFETLSRLN